MVGPQRGASTPTAAAPGKCGYGQEIKPPDRFRGRGSRTGYGGGIHFLPEVTVRVLASQKPIAGVD